MWLMLHIILYPVYGVLLLSVVFSFHTKSIAVYCCRSIVFFFGCVTLLETLYMAAVVVFVYGWDLDRVSG